MSIRRCAVASIILILSSSLGVASINPPAVASVRNLPATEDDFDAALVATDNDPATDYPGLTVPASSSGPATFEVATTTDPSDPILADASTLQVTIGDSDASSGELLSDGLSTSFQSTDQQSEVVVQPAGESARALVVMKSNAAAHSYSFDFASEDVAYLDMEPDSGEVYGYNAQGDVTLIIDPAWAVDNRGWDVQTWYEIDGTTLTQVINSSARNGYPVVADPDFIFAAKCGLGIAQFVAENAAIIGKFWKVFKSAKALIKLFKDIRKMSKAGKISYIKGQLGAIAADFTGIGDLVSRCTP